MIPTPPLQLGYPVVLSNLELRLTRRKFLDLLFFAFLYVLAPLLEFLSFYLLHRLLAFALLMSTPICATLPGYIFHTDV